MASAPLSAAAMRQLAKDLSDLQATPCEGIRVVVNEQDLADVQAEIEGPAGTPYAGGLFRMRLSLPADFPDSPPKGYFLTKIYHPNVSKAGEICVNVLKRDWKPDLGLRHVLLVIRCLLIEPFPESALNEEAGKALLEDYAEYCKVRPGPQTGRQRTAPCLGCPTQQSLSMEGPHSHAQGANSHARRSTPLAWSKCSTRA
jgi:ubiquitin-conjugating enzyme E2 S